MKKNKGLTLVELLVIIVVIGLLLTITSMSVTRIMQGTKKNIREQELSALCDGAKSYFNDVINGDESYILAGPSYKGYSFLEKISDLEFCTNINNCLTTKDGDVYTTEIKLTPSSNFEKYIEADKYKLSSCAVVATIKYSKNSYGYLQLNSLDVAPASGTKAEKCVK